MLKPFEDGRSSNLPVPWSESSQHRDARRASVGDPWPRVLSRAVAKRPVRSLRGASTRLCFQKTSVRTTSLGSSVRDLIPTTPGSRTSQTCLEDKNSHSPDSQIRSPQHRRRSPSAARPDPCDRASCGDVGVISQHLPATHGDSI